MRLELGVRDWMKIISLHATCRTLPQTDFRLTMCCCKASQKRGPSLVQSMHCASAQAIARSHAQRLYGCGREALLVTGTCLGGSRPYTKTRFLRRFIKLCKRRAWTAQGVLAAAEMHEEGSMRRLILRNKLPPFVRVLRGRRRVLQQKILRQSRAVNIQSHESPVLETSTLALRRRRQTPSGAGRC